MHSRNHRFARSACAILTIPMIAALCGCVQETPATFQAAGGGNPLDGGVISNDGNTIELQLTDDGSALGTVFISGSGGDSSITFGDPVDGVAVPRDIEVNGGASSLSVDRDTEIISISTTVLGTQVSFNDTLPQELSVTRDILLPDARSAAGVDTAATCDIIVDSIDLFCTRYNANRDASLEEVVAFGVEIAERQLGGSFGNGVVESTIREYYDAIDVFCDGFTELSSGEDGPVDLCESVR